MNWIDLDKLNEKETQEMRDLHDRWMAARARQDYELSDLLRSELEHRGAMSPDYRLWHPVMESKEARKIRMKGR